MSGSSNYIIIKSHWSLLDAIILIPLFLVQHCKPYTTVFSSFPASLMTFLPIDLYNNNIGAFLVLWL